jgi:hypothetical protein
LVAAAKQGAQGWSAGLVEVAACLEQCLDAEQHVAANAHPTTTIECWVDNLAEAMHGR